MLGDSQKTWKSLQSRSTVNLDNLLDRSLDLCQEMLQSLWLSYDIFAP